MAEIKKGLAHLTNTATILAIIVIALGAYTRLKDAGLGCPDWPGCYGRFIAPADAKAWIEMIHRYVAGSLGLLVFYITYKYPSKLTFSLAAIVILQAALGMWTVTLKLYPIIVMAHFLGGVTIAALLLFTRLNLIAPSSFNNTPAATGGGKFLQVLSITSLAILFIQLFLGAWTSANYAALVCSDFPTCQGQWLPTLDWQHAFNLSAVGIMNSPGTALENTARVTIQFAHRLGALITTISITWLSFKLTANKISPQFRQLGLLSMSLLILQITLGIINVLAGLPIAIAVLHNIIAALLLLTLVIINFLVFRHA